MASVLRLGERVSAHGGMFTGDPGVVLELDVEDGFGNTGARVLFDAWNGDGIFVAYSKLRAL